MGGRDARWAVVTDESEGKSELRVVAETGTRAQLIEHGEFKEALITVSARMAGRARGGRWESGSVRVRIFRKGRSRKTLAHSVRSRVFRKVRRRWAAHC